MGLLERVEQNIRARCLLKRGARVVVAVSGGLDSMVLLQLLRTLAAEQGWRIVVAHFNHRLRGRSSQADERLVRQTARELGLPCVVDAGEVRQCAAGQGISLEMAARRMRHAFLARVARQHRARQIALAHHADDQVELFFLRLLRGAGAGGLAGMKWISPSPADRQLRLIRPLLDQRKTALQQYARDKRIKFREDATNAALDILRNRVRHKLLPVLRREFQPSLDAVVLRQMEILAGEDDFLAAAVEERGQGGAGDPFERWPVALQRRYLQQQVLRLDLAADFGLVEQLRTAPGKKIMVAPGRTVGRDPAGMVREMPAAEPGFAGEERQIRLRGSSGRMIFGGREFQWVRGRQSRAALPRPRSGCEWFDADQVGAEIVLRHWRRGDRFQPIGMGEAVKVQDLFTNLKVPAAERHRRVVACTTAGVIWWVEGLRVAEPFKVGAGTRRRLKWAWRVAERPGLNRGVCA